MQLNLSGIPTNIAQLFKNWQNKGIGTDNLTDDSVTKEKINSNIAGDGLEQDSDGSLKVSIYIAEEGDNAVGHYRIWSNGVVECWGVKDLGTINVNSPWGVGYISYSYSISWPITLATVQYSSINLLSGTPYGLIICMIGNASITGQNFVFFRGDSLTNITPDASFYVRGTV